jgi:hypothetical protein
MLNSTDCLNRSKDCLWYLSNKNNNNSQCINRVCNKTLNSNECESMKIDDIEIKCVLGEDNLKNKICVVEHSMSCDFYKSSSGCTWSDSNENTLNIVCKWNESEGSCSISDDCSSLGIVGIECESFNSSRGKCFLNGDNNLTTIDKHCSDVFDVISCSELQSLNLCCNR